MTDDALPPHPDDQANADAFLPDPALFARWRSAVAPAYASSEMEPVDALTLAAYLDGRADAAEQERVEAALLRRPDLLDALLDQKRAPVVAEPPSPALLAAACALVPKAATASAGILVFRPSAHTRRDWRRFVPMSAMAASVALVALLGFDIGLHAQEHLSTSPTAASPNMFDPQTLLQDNELG